MNVAVVNLGCKVNRVESDTIALGFLNRGATLTSEDKADLIIINTCTVTGEAEKKTRKALRRALRASLHAQVVVTGCAAAINPDFFASFDSRVKVVSKFELLNPALSTQGQNASLTDDQGSYTNVTRVGGTFPSRAAIKVQDGCNHACSYCIVHVARGRAWSKPPDKVVAEAVDLALAGAYEIVLTGIDLGSYSYQAKGKRVRLDGLVSSILEALDAAGKPECRIRASSIEPHSLNKGFINLLSSSQNRLCRQVHLPLQSGSSRVLAEMNRPYSAQAFLDLVNLLYDKVPGIAITTDVIVGFPGETEQDFEETLRVCKQARFAKIHVFRYSVRAGTPAAERKDQIDPRIKERRARKLIALGDELRLNFARSLVGKPADIVLEGQGWGMTESYFKVRLNDAVLPQGLMRTTLARFDEHGIFYL